MREILSDYFVDISRVIADNGGDILKIAGDAIIAFWPANGEDNTLVKSTCAAVTAAHELGRKFGSHQVGI
jgi:class 3 adenylate cyclase